MNAQKYFLSLGLLCALNLAPGNLFAGQFKRISIDGSFDDWAGVPPAYEDAQDATGAFDFKAVYLANDDKYLYIRVQLYAPANYGLFHHHVLIDADNNSATGSMRLGVGSEFMIEDGVGYQQKNGSFNEGMGSNLDWAEAPTGVLTEFEVRISRDVRDNEGLPVFTGNDIVLAVEAQDRNWNTVDAAPDAGGTPYSFAPTPSKATGTTTLVSLSSTPWRVNDAGTELGTNWLALDYDDTQAGWKGGSGLFGFGSPAGTYPASIQTPLTSGHTTYYLRVPFTWNYDAFGIALAVDGYVSDGAVFYLNGVELKRLRLPSGPLSYNTRASGGSAAPGKAETFTLPPAALIVGNNVLQVEVHATAAVPTALAFGLKLVATDSLAPSIEDPSQPADRTVVEGDPTTFGVGNVLGTVPLGYQWSKDGAPIDGATNATFTIPVVLVSDAGQYQVTIANATGTKATSRAALLTTTAVSVSITNNAAPADRTIAEGESTTFAIQVAGSPILYYQWVKDGVPIAGATNASFAITNASLSDAGSYSVSVSNRLNSVTSRQARLNVGRDLVPPAITQVTGSASKVVVQFSEPLDQASANTAAFYTLSAGATVQTARLDLTDLRTVTLTTTPLKFGTIYTLGVNGVKDRFNNPASTSAPFRATILIDGNFDDWTGITPQDTETQDTPDGKEFKDITVANDDDYLYLRFSFYANVGRLPVDAYFHIFSDTDNDPATGFVTAGLGSEMMIENGSGYQQKNGQFNEGTASGLDFAIAPAAASDQFECRISRKAVYDSDGQPVYTGDTIALALQLISTTWAAIDTAPVTGGLVYTFTKLAPLTPSPLHVSLSGGNVQIIWTGSGVLEATDTLTGANWKAVANATSPYSVSPAGQQRYFRLRL